MRLPVSCLNFSVRRREEGFFSTVLLAAERVARMLVGFRRQGPMLAIRERVGVMGQVTVVYLNWGGCVVKLFLSGVRGIHGSGIASVDLFSEETMALKGPALVLGRPREIGCVGADDAVL